jgi:uncharacterized protein YjbI with pentapeptide repeats
LLKKEVDAWNSWRNQNRDILYQADENRDIKPDLYQGDLGEADLSEAALSEAALGRANLNGADLGRTNPGRANLVDTDLVNADLTGCRIYGVSAWNLKLERARQRSEGPDAARVGAGQFKHRPLSSSGVQREERSVETVLQSRN